MLSALLTGISRAFPFAPKNDASYEEHINSLFKMVHLTSFNKSVQALLVILQLLFSQANTQTTGLTPQQIEETVRFFFMLVQASDYLFQMY